MYVLSLYSGALWMLRVAGWLAGHPGRAAREGREYRFIDMDTESFEKLVASLKAPVVVGSSTLCTEQKGCFARRQISEGCELWHERPLLSDQELGNDVAVLACAQCCCWLGDRSFILEAVIGWARSKIRGNSPVPQRNVDNVATKQAISCSGACGNQYCSTECRDAHWSSHHRMLCTGLPFAIKSICKSQIKFRCAGCGAGKTPDELSKGAALHRGALLCYEKHAFDSGHVEPLRFLALATAQILCRWEASVSF